ncbi:MAG: hypothetical protein V1750_02500, partial [Acidobacteriota bacterium]
FLRLLRVRMRRWRPLGLAVAMLAGGLLLHRFWLRELSHLTGEAEWIWVTDALERVYPVAGLFVARLDLAAPPPSALLKACGDREYVVYINGTAAACGWSRPGFRLDMYEVSHLLRQGENVIAVEARSPTPAGGLLVALDVGGVGQNVLVSGPSFTSRRTFSLARAVAGDDPVPVRWGVPPHFPWGYPQPQPYRRTLDQTVVDEPVRVEAAKAVKLPGGGVSFALPEPVFSYLWLEFDGDGPCYLATTSEREGGELGELRRVAQPVARLRGQARWLDPEPRLFGAIYAFGRRLPSAVELWPVAEELRPGAPGAVRGRHGLVPRTRWTTRTPPG